MDNVSNAQRLRAEKAHNIRVTKLKQITSNKKKRECSARAQEIVEFLIDGVSDESLFLDKLKWINQSHFQDVIEERAIIKLCGYPLCNASLGEMPKKQYHISYQRNKVYDITERKNFCSNQCYKSGMFLKRQLLTSPLWMRESETIPKFTLYCNPRGSTGEEVDFGIYTVHTETDLNTEALDEDESMSMDTERLHDNTVDNINDNITNDVSNSNVEVRCGNISEVNANDHMETEDIVILRVEKRNSSAVANDIVENVVPSAATRVRPAAAPRRSQRVTSTRELAAHVEQSLAEWFTLDSLTFVIGAERTEQLLLEHGKVYDRTTFVQPEAPFYEKYDIICRKLKILELAEERRNREYQGYRLPTKAIPDYEALKAGAKDMEIKVRQYLWGERENREMNVDDQEEDEKPSTSAEVAQKESNQSVVEEPNDDYDEPVMPVLQQHAAKSIRRNIVINKLKFMLPDLFKLLDINDSDTMDIIKNFVRTFNLSAHNITFKPLEWNLIGLMLIKVLSTESKYLQSCLENKKNYIYSMLMSYQLENSYLDMLCDWLMDIENIYKRQNL